MSRPAFLSPLPWAAAAALALHWVLLDAVGDTPPRRPSSGVAGTAGAMLTRQLLLATPAPVVRTAPPAARARRPTRPPQPQPPVTAPPHDSPAAITALIPPAVIWQYALRQGEALGHARLSWQPAGPHYQARLERELPGRTLPAWHSQGGFDAQGLAPERFAQQRRGRDSQATNFRRAQGVLSFSASPALLALPPGAQDRVSWMLQLAALLAADPALRAPGAALLLPVAGLRGELAAWEFVVTQIEDLALPIGPAGNTVRLHRAAQAPYDVDIDIWLDPARHYLPVRLRQRVGEAPDWELLLQQQVPPDP